MTEKNRTTPGIQRQERISDEGLNRLEKKLMSGSRISTAVKQQWIKRYGEQAQKLFNKYN
ncbi:MAG: hypothetical protein P8Y20_08270 [Gammaproteobacteria bacterium]|jgi:hypothetical protein